MAHKKSLWNTQIVVQAALDSFRKLDPRWMVKNPVMFVVEVGSVLTTFLLIDNAIHDRPGFGFNLQITLWLWFTVLFANFAEAMAEGRGKAQADTLRKAKGETTARRYTDAGGFEEVISGQLRAEDVIYVEAGEYIAGDGEVIEGVATVDESAITGESAPVIREAGGDRSAVTGGTRVLSDWIKVRITSNPGETFLDRMIALVEGATRQKTPNEIALSILLSGLTIIFLLAGILRSKLIDVPLDALNQLGIRLRKVRPSRRRGVVSIARRRGARMEVAVRGKALRDQLGTNHLAVLEDEAPSGLARKQYSGYACNHERIDNAEQNRRHEREENGGLPH